MKQLKRSDLPLLYSIKEKQRHMDRIQKQVANDLISTLNPHARSHGTTINETWQTGDVDIVSAGDILISTAKIELILGL